MDTGLGEAAVETAAVTRTVAATVICVVAVGVAASTVTKRSAFVGVVAFDVTIAAGTIDLAGVGVSTVDEAASPGTVDLAEVAVSTSEMTAARRAIESVTVGLVAVIVGFVDDDASGTRSECQSYQQDQCRSEGFGGEETRKHDILVNKSRRSESVVMDGREAGLFNMRSRFVQETARILGFRRLS